MMDKKHCAGCYNDFYNYGGVDGNCKQCMQLKTAKLEWCRIVSIDTLPKDFHKIRKTRKPSCYRKQRYVIFRKGDREY